VRHGPTPTTSVDAALADVDAHGLAILTGALEADECADVRARLWSAADRSDFRGVPTRGYGFDPDGNNRRVFLLFNLDPVFIKLIGHPLATRFVDAVLGPSWIISNFSANITGPGSGAMGLHADQGYALPPWPTSPLAINVAWILDDYTEDVGATRYVPGSHLLGHGPTPGEVHDTAPVLAPAGSLMVMDGRLWHQTGINTTADRHRAALFGYYVLPWIRPQVNWNRALDPDVVDAADEQFLHRLGYYGGNQDELAATFRDHDDAAGH
jgi:fumagillin biosynthesis dioxygenase